MSVSPAIARRAFVSQQDGPGERRIAPRFPAYPAVRERFAQGEYIMSGWHVPLEEGLWRTWHVMCW